MSDNVSERMAIIETTAKHQDKKIDDLITICQDMNRSLVDMGKDISALKEGMTWVKRGIVGIFVAIVLALIKYLFFVK